MERDETVDGAPGFAPRATPSANRDELPAALALLPRTSPAELPHQCSGSDGFAGCCGILLNAELRKAPG
jgi:hypothetical protein